MGARRREYGAEGVGAESSGVEVNPLLGTTVWVSPLLSAMLLVSTLLSAMVWVSISWVAGVALLCIRA